LGNNKNHVLHISPLAAAVIHIRRRIFNRRKFYGAVPRMRVFDEGRAGRLATCTWHVLHFWKQNELKMKLLSCMPYVCMPLMYAAHVCYTMYTLSTGSHPPPASASTVPVESRPMFSTGLDERQLTLQSLYRETQPCLHYYSFTISNMR